MWESFEYWYFKEIPKGVCVELKKKKGYPQNKAQVFSKSNNMCGRPDESHIRLRRNRKTKLLCP